MIWLLLLSVVTALSTALWPDLTSSLVFSLGLFVLLLIRLRRTVDAEDGAYLVRVTILAFVLRLTCTYIVEAVHLIDKADSLYYHRIGSQVAQYLLAGRFEELYSWMHGFGHPGYELTVGVEYVFLGSNILVGQTLNALASSFTIVPIYFLAREISVDARVARLAAIGFACLPNSVIWSTQLLKDSVVVLLEITLALDLVRLLNREFQMRTLIRLIVCTVLLSEFRFYIPLLMYSACALACAPMAWRTLRRQRGRTMVFAVALLVTSSVAIALTGTMWKGYLNIEDWDQLDNLRAATLGGESDFAKQAQLSSPEQLIKFLPVGAAYFLAGPPPWEARKTAHYLTWLDIPIWYPALVLGFPGILMLLRRKEAIPLVSICLGLTVFYSIFLGNLGTGYRMRLQATPFYLLAAADCWCQLAERKHLARRPSPRWEMSW